MAICPNRLTSIVSTTSAVAVASFKYGYNSANQRTSVTNVDNSYWVYQYDSLGQVVSGKKYWSDGTPVAGQQFQYGFDDIGNRTSTAAGGDQWGVNLRWASYFANSLNQYTNRTVPGAVDVIGTATNTATVTVNNNSAYRKGSYYRVALPLTNSSGAIWQSITNLAVLNNGTNSDIITNVTGNVFLPQTPESFSYDADGNLTQDGRWQYTWDAENRLVSMQAISAVPTTAKVKLDFLYDWQGRRIQKIVSTNNGSAYYPFSTNKFVYDAWNLVCELGATNSSVLRAYTWGLDLSGSLRGAGGVGGLLVVSQSASNTTQFACYDGNGNVAALVDTTAATVTGQYEYGPFGEMIRATGMAKGNPLRFSTKYQDDETDLLYYGFRYYSASTGKWLSLDPAAEAGGVNLYGFLANDAQDRWDSLGNRPAWQLYCGAAKKHPENQWLKCACDVSHEINQLIFLLYITAPGVKDPNMNGKIIKWFDCMRSCLLEKFKEFYKVYDEGASFSDGLTPYWNKACRICIGAIYAENEKACCKAMVDAEQHRAEDCFGTCGAFPGNANALPIPGFKGDFSKLEDRLRYGYKRCCGDTTSQ